MLGVMDATTQAKIEQLKKAVEARDKADREAKRLAAELVDTQVFGIRNAVAGILGVTRETVRRSVADWRKETVA